VRSGKPIASGSNLVDLIESWHHFDRALAFPEPVRNLIPGKPAQRHQRRLFLIGQRSEPAFGLRAGCRIEISCGIGGRPYPQRSANGAMRLNVVFPRRLGHADILDSCTGYCRQRIAFRFSAHGSPSTHDLPEESQTAVGGGRTIG